MLIEFRVSNHRSIQEEQVLSLEADGRLGAKTDLRPRTVVGHAKKVLPVAALYGANASGKSNVLSGIEFMRYAVIYSYRFWNPDGGIPRECFAWGEYMQKPSIYEVTFIQSGVRYEYGFVADSECFLEEWLFAWPKGSKQKWYERTKNKFHFGENLRGENKNIAKTTRKNALFLSSAMQQGHQQLTDVYHWFSVMKTEKFKVRGLASFGNPISWFFPFLRHKEGSQQMLFPEEENIDNNMIKKMRKLLKAADVGIVDLKLKKADNNRNREIIFRHEGSSDSAWLPLHQESNGTKTLIKLIPAILPVLEEGGVLVIDELESSLHPSLSLKIVELFNNENTNPNNAQLIFSTHDTNLIGNLITTPPLRRDQVWLTEKNTEGATCLYPLTDYRPRKEENLERGYLQGRYGGIPFLDNLINFDDFRSK